MKKFLPKTANNPHGFTLVELMVVVAIIAILAAAGFVIFTGQQKNARDARRRTDIDAIAQAMEAGKTSGAATYNSLASTMFANGAIPADPGGNGIAAYCASSGTAVATVWANSSACPTTPTTFTAITTGNPGNTATWTVCASLESGTFYCRTSAQQ